MKENNLTGYHDCSHQVSKSAKVYPSCDRPRPILTPQEDIEKQARKANANRKDILMAC